MMSTLTLSQQNNLVARRVGGRSANIKTHFALRAKRYSWLKLVVILVVLMENSKNTCQMNDYGNIKQILNELMRVDIAA